MLERLLTASGTRLSIGAVPGNSNPTLAELATAVDVSTGRLKIDWTRLRGFADWAAQHRDDVGGAIAEPPVRTGTALDAILAAFAEQLAIEHCTTRPRWTRSVGPLDEPWSPPATPRMRAAAELTTPEPFKRRNVVLAKSSLFRSAA